MKTQRTATSRKPKSPRGRASYAGATIKAAEYSNYVTSNDGPLCQVVHVRDDGTESLCRLMTKKDAIRHASHMMGMIAQGKYRVYEVASVVLTNREVTAAQFAASDRQEMEKELARAKTWGKTDRAIARIRNEFEARSTLRRATLTELEAIAGNRAKAKQRRRK